MFWFEGAEDWLLWEVVRVEFAGLMLEKGT